MLDVGLSPVLCLSCIVLVNYNLQTALLIRDHLLVYIRKRFPATLFYLYIVSFVLIYSTETNIALESCDIRVYAFVKNDLSCTVLYIYIYIYIYIYNSGIFPTIVVTLKYYKNFTQAECCKSFCINLIFRSYMMVL